MFIIFLKVLYFATGSSFLDYLFLELEKEMATHSSILAWRISWTEEPGQLQSMGLQRVGHDLATHTHTHIFIIIISGDL